VLVSDPKSETNYELAIVNRLTQDSKKIAHFRAIKFMFKFN
jgi:hypothetical protein